MQKLILAFLIWLVHFPLFAQIDTSQLIVMLFEQEQYDQLIESYAAGAERYSSEANVLICQSYLRKNDMQNGVKHLEIAIQKDSENAYLYYVKGLLLGYQDKNEEAEANYKKAIELDPENPDYYLILGELYSLTDRMQEAMALYHKVIQFDRSNADPYIMIAEAFNQQDQLDSAIAVLSLAITAVPDTSTDFPTILYNIGNLEYLNGAYDKAETALLGLLQLIPNEPYGCEKLIQVYFKTEAYDKVRPYRKLLNELQEAGTLPQDFSGRFCYDQFEWEDKSIRAYERLGKSDSPLYYQHIYYVINQEGDIESTIQTEYSAILAELGDGKYILGRDWEDGHATYGIGFQEDLDYTQLKKAVIDVLEDRVKPTAGTGKSGKD